MRFRGVLLTSWLVLTTAVTVPPGDDAINAVHEETVRHFNKGPHSHTLVEQTFKTPRSRHRRPQQLPPPRPHDQDFYYMEMRPEYTNAYGDGFQAAPPVTGYGGYGLREYGSEEEKGRFLCLVLGICGSIFPASSSKRSLVTFYEWKQLEFDYLSEQERNTDLQSGYWNPSVTAPIDVDTFYGNGVTHRIFVTIPRFQVGSPVTLGEVTDKKRNGDPVIRPYPSWNWHRNPTQCNPDRLVSVYRVKIDECGRLWILDTGKYGDQQTCEPQILAFDLNTDKLLHRFTIPSHLLESRSILVTPVVDVRDGQCRDTFVYVADCQTYAIIVYDVTTGRSWRAIDKTMYPHPEYGTFNIQGDQFDLMDGVLGMDLQPYIPGRDRKLFYHAMSSPSESWVYTSDLRNETRFTLDPSSSPEIYHMYKSKRPSQSCAMAIDRNGISYFGLMSETSINCWNTASPEYGKYINTIRRDPVTLQFTSGVKVINNKLGGQELWFLTSRFQKVATGTLDTKEINFRVNAGKIPFITENTGCSIAGGGGGGGGGGIGGYGFKPNGGGGYGYLKGTTSLS